MTRAAVRTVLVFIPTFCTLVVIAPSTEAAALKITPGGLNFGNVVYGGKNLSGAPSKSKSLTISNPKGRPAISGLTFELSGTDPGDFQVGPGDCTSELAGGARCALTLIFTPESLATRGASLALTDGVGTPLGMVALRGVGTRVKKLITSSNALSFGKVKVGQSSAPKVVRVRNPNDFALNIQSITTSASEFVQTDNCGPSLAGGGSCQISVTFKPTIQCDPKTTRVNGALKIANDAGLDAVNLSGVAVNQGSDALFVANYGSNAVTAYPLSGHGNQAPIASIGDPTNLDSPVSIATGTDGKIYVANQNDSTLTIYATRANGTSAPVASIGGANTGLSSPTGIALDSKANIYVADRGGPTFNGTVKIFPPLGSSSGSLDEVPTAIISAPSSGTDNTGLASPSRVTLDSGGKIYVTNTLPGSITVYPPLGSSIGNLNEAPVATISGANTGLIHPQGLALDALGNIYVADASGAILIFPPLGSGAGILDQVPIAIITGSNTGLLSPGSVALDSTQRIYALDAGFADSITIYPPLGTLTGVLDEAPVATITAVTGQPGTPALALDSTDQIYVVNLYNNSVTVYPALGSAVGTITEAPVAVITGADTGLNLPQGIALDSRANIYVSNEIGGNFGVGSITVYRAGSNGDATPMATIAGSNALLNFPMGIAIGRITR